jgi:hypothetical protein
VSAESLGPSEVGFGERSTPLFDVEAGVEMLRRL